MPLKYNLKNLVFLLRSHFVIKPIILILLIIKVLRKGKTRLHEISIAIRYGETFAGMLKANNFLAKSLTTCFLSATCKKLKPKGL